MNWIFVCLFSFLLNSYLSSSATGACLTCFLKAWNICIYFGWAFLILIECYQPFSNSNDNESGWTVDDIINLQLTLNMSFLLPRDFVLSFLWNAWLWGWKLELTGRDPPPSTVLKAKTLGIDYVRFPRGWRKKNPTTPESGKRPRQHLLEMA